MHIPTRKSWCFTVVYGFNELGDRVELWRDLCSIGDSITLPWVCAGDLNNILNPGDRLGTVFNANECGEFRDCLASNDLRDIQFK